MHRKHVLGDLQPYACTYPDCDLLEHAFESRDNWYKHETQHHRVEWFCNFDGHQQYNEQSNFIAHMEKDHQTAFDKGQLSLLRSMFQRPLRNPEGNCNLCLRSCANLKSHVGRHLEQIALFALPRTNETTGSEATQLDSQQIVNGSIGRNRPQDKLTFSGSGQSSSKIVEAQRGSIENNDTEGSDIDDQVDQAIVTDAHVSWGRMIDKFSYIPDNYRPEDSPSLMSHRLFPISRSVKKHRKLPYSQNIDFTGHEDPIAQLVELMASMKTGHHRVALSGLGGTGYVFASPPEVIRRLI
jgi:hypothetical protein